MTIDKSNNASRPTLTKNDWVEAAQQILIKNGIDAVRVDSLAKELNITRGSFYYHFKSRLELLENILTHWRTSTTERIILQLNKVDLSPKERLKQLLELPFHGKSATDTAAFEIAIRGWARRDPLARQAMDEVDRHRLAYIQSLLHQDGRDEIEAKDTANLIYAYLLSISLVLPEQSKEKRYEQHLRIIQQWL